MVFRRLINYTPEVRVMKKSEILEIIKEEVEVVLTNAEMIEMFDLDPAALLDEIMKEEEKGEKGYERPLEAALEEEKLDIEKMDLKKGRCTPMGTAECPEGSPQYNLAKRFKSGDIHKANLKKGKNPDGPG